MKAVLLSTQPKWCELIASGKKTVEVRKTKPSIGTPLKCYIYCTKDINLRFWTGKRYSYADDRSHNAFDKCGNGKVIGEFVCYDISTYCTEFYPQNRQPIFEAVYQLNEEQSDEQEKIWEVVLSNDIEYKTRFEEETCLSLEDFRNYLGIGENQFYGWRISDLVIYGEPKELSEFCSPNTEQTLTRPPQSWCYVKEREQQ